MTHHLTVVSKDYNGAEKFLWPSDVIAHTLFPCLGDAGVNKPTTLPASYMKVLYIVHIITVACCTSWVCVTTFHDVSTRTKSPNEYFSECILSYI